MVELAQITPKILKKQPISLICKNNQILQAIFTYKWRSKIKIAWISSELQNKLKIPKWAFPEKPTFL